METMSGWAIPPPCRHVKPEGELRRERVAAVARLVAQGFLRSKRLADAMRKVPREKFMPSGYMDYAYEELPFPLPGNGVNQTISCPHSYPLFYEALELEEGDKFLEVGTGSGYGAALAREVVGENGLVVTIELNPMTYEFARENLLRMGYGDVVAISADGAEGYPDAAPYDKICVTAACPTVPGPLITQLADPGRLAAPIGPPNSAQKLVLLRKKRGRVTSCVIDEVLYVSLLGKHGWKLPQRDPVGTMP